MQNLNINKITHQQFPKQHEIIKAMHCGTFACLLAKTRESYSLTCATYYKPNAEVTPDSTVNLDIEDESITSDLQYLPLINSAFLTTSTRVFIVDLGLHDVRTIQIPNAENDNVLAAAFNSEQDSLAVIYESGRVMVYCINYVTNEMMMLAEDHPDLKDQQNVYLGWGDVKKQFKGKPVASYLKESHPPESKYEDSTSTVSISWQFGEKYFLVNSQLNGERVIRIFDLECRLFQTITKVKVPGICAKSVYRSKHNTIATVCQGIDGNSYVVMHERNGEYYNTINPFTNAQIKDIQFSTCGKIFAIFSQTNANYYLDIYTQSNFIWQHKFRFTGDLTHKLNVFKFDSTLEGIYPIEMVFDDGIVHYYLAKHIVLSQSNDKDHKQKVFVQSANNLYVFNYHKCVIPPCGDHNITLCVDEPINHLASYNNSLVLVDAKEVAYFYKFINDEWVFKDKINLKDDTISLPIFWHRFYLIEVDGVESLVAVGTEGCTVFIKKVISLQNGEASITTFENIDSLYKTCEDEITAIEKGTYRSLIKSAYKFIFGDKFLLCVLIHNGDIFLDKTLFMKAVTSILNYKNSYLLMTVTGFEDPMDRLFCIDVQQLLKTGPKVLNKISYSRRIEKGATLVSIANNDGSVVLEMPRGNIEIVTVRPIILRNVYQKIVDGDFNKAYHLVRRHAMKMDVLYDLAPHLFHNNVYTFVKSLGSAESVIKFLLSLKNASTLTRTDFLFVDEYPVEDKKNKICDAIIEIYKDVKCTESDTRSYRIICIALFVKNNHDTYESLKFLVNRIGGWYTPIVLGQVCVVVTLLKMYADINEMYKQALTLYDVHLATIIAEVAGMDPQIYGRFLTECRYADDITRRFLMANEGGNFKGAALYLLMLYREKKRGLNEIIEYAKDKTMLDVVYNAMTPNDGDALLKVCKILSEKHIANRNYLEGASVLCKAGLNIKAIDLLISGVCYKEASDLIACIGELDNDGMLEKFEKLAIACVADGKDKEALSIYLEKCGDVKKALDCCLSGGLFKEYVRILEDEQLSIQVPKEEYLEKLKFQLIENMSNIQISLESNKKSFKMHFERLRIVRETRKNRAECAVDGDDAYSEAGSVTTRSHSSYASSTTRKTRKLEMKLRSLRHGGKYEDIALIRELYEVINNVFNQSKDLEMLEEVYKQYADIDTTEIFITIEKLQGEMNNAAGVIWIPEYSTNDDDVLIADFMTENIVHLEKKFRSMPESVKDVKDVISM